MLLLRSEGLGRAGLGARATSKLQRTPAAQARAVTGRTAPLEGAGEGGRGLGWRELGDDAAAEQATVRVVQRARLPGGDGPDRLGEIEGDRPVRMLPHAAGNGRGTVAALDQHR